jgi:hypothetical protein
LLSQRQQSLPQDDDRERIARARLAAEALFTAKPPIGEHPATPTQAPAGQTARKPRVLSIVPPALASREPVRTPSARRRKPIKRRIPRAEHAQIRTWVHYGMTTAEVAGVCGVEVAEVERILSKS